MASEWFFFSPEKVLADLAVSKSTWDIVCVEAEKFVA